MNDKDHADHSQPESRFVHDCPICSKLAVRNMSAVEGAGAEAAAVKHPVYQGFEAHRDGSYQGIIPPQSKTFHGSRCLAPVIVLIDHNLRTNAINELRSHHHHR